MASDIMPEGARACIPSRKKCPGGGALPVGPGAAGARLGRFRGAGRWRGGGARRVARRRPARALLVLGLAGWTVRLITLLAALLLIAPLATRLLAVRGLIGVLAALRFLRVLFLRV